MSGSLCMLAVVASMVPTRAVHQDEPRARVVQTPEDGQPIVARTDDQGSIHLLFQTSNGPRYICSRNGGKSFESSIPVVQGAAHKPGLEFQGWDMAIGAKGSVHVALGTNAWKLKLPKPEWAFHYARLAPGAKAFSAVRNLNETPSEGFSLATDGQGKVTACWLSGKLYANISRDDGVTFNSTIEVDPSINPCDCCTTSVAYGGDGKLAILYREETNNERDMYLALWDQTRGHVKRSRVSGVDWKTNSCPMTYYSVVRDHDGFVTAYSTKGTIYARRVNAGGLASPVELKTPGRSGMRTGVIALRNQEGDMLVAWKVQSELGWLIYDPDGKPRGVPNAVKSAGSGAAAVVTKEGAFVLFR